MSEICVTPGTSPCVHARTHIQKEREREREREREKDSERWVAKDTDVPNSIQIHEDIYQTVVAAQALRQMPRP